MEVQYLLPVDIFAKILGQKIQPPKKGNSLFVGVFFHLDQNKVDNQPPNQGGLGVCPKEMCSNALVLCCLFGGLTDHQFTKIHDK